jgi:dATP pyrophosphohydrolase
MSKMRQPFQVSVYPVRVVDKACEYLLLRRVPKPKLGLDRFWQGITGGIEEGEGIVEAAMRELDEETKLVPAALEQVDYSYSFPVDDRWRHMYAAGVEEILEYVFVAFIDGYREPSISQEHDKWRWCKLKRALGMLKYPGNVEALKRCDRLVKIRLDGWRNMARHNNRSRG